jgi:hypothetical protein
VILTITAPNGHSVDVDTEENPHTCIIDDSFTCIACVGQSLVGQSDKAPSELLTDDKFAPLTIDQVIDEATAMGLLEDDDRGRLGSFAHRVAYEKSAEFRTPAEQRMADEFYDALCRATDSDLGDPNESDLVVELRYYAYPGYDATGFVQPATAWYYQGGPQWMAVVAEQESEADWFVDSEPGDCPTPRTYPIDQRPPYGRLIYRTADGSEVSEPASTDPKDAALAEWRRRAEQAERALDEHEAHEENARRTPKPNWVYPLYAKCKVCGEELQFDIDPGGTPGQNGDWGANGDYGCITGDDEGTDGHTPIKIKWKP